MNSLKKLGYVAAALALAASFSGCGLIPTSPPQSGGSEPTSAAPAEETGWPEASRKEFLKSCETTSGGMTEYCECALQESEKKFTYAEMVDLEKRAATDPSAVDEMQSVIQACAHLAS